jgi:hypothetical protein
MGFKTPLEAAIAQLVAEGRVKGSADVARDLKLKSRGTVSSYVTGKAMISENFKSLFENTYNIRLKDFEGKVGAGIKNPGPEPDQGYKDLYIAQLKEHNDFLKKRVADLEAVRDQLTAIERTLSEVRTDMGVISALQQGYQEYWAEYYPPKNVKPADVQRMIHTKAALRLAKIQKEGIHL